MLKKMFFSFIVTGLLSAVSVTAFAQVDDPKTSPDTLYIYEEEVVYDTLYVYDSTSSSIPKSKEELLQALQRDRGVGKLYHQRGAMYLNGAGGELFRLNDIELKGLLSASDYTANDCSSGCDIIRRLKETLIWSLQEACWRQSVRRRLR